MKRIFKNLNSTRGFCALALIIIAFFGLLFSGQVMAKEFNYLMGSTRTTSSTYPPAVAGSEVINKYAPDVQVTLIATGSTHDNLKRFRTGDLQYTMVTNPDGAAMSYAGVRKYDKPDKTVRLFFYYMQNITHITVREDTDIHKLEDLNGRKFHAGGIGFASTYNTKAIFEALDIKPDWFIGSLSDAVAAIKDNRCRGYSKSGAGLCTIDSTTMDIMTKTPVRIISFTDEQLETAMQTIPGLYPGEEPAGCIEQLDHPTIKSFVNGLASYGTKEIPQEIGYQIVKAVVEHYDHIVNSCPNCGNIDPVKDTILRGAETAELSGLPLHAGAVQYFEEIGEEVPSVLIPPEYEKK